MEQVDLVRGSNEKAQENRERVIDAAAARLRKSGLDGINIVDLMKSAGMTHGGFYKQFKSKDDLVLQGVKRAIEGSSAAIKLQLTEADDPLAALIRFYVSPEHRDNPASGCSLASLATDAARSNAPDLQALIGDLVARYLELLTDLSSGQDDTARNHAIATLAEMVGAVILARAVPDRALSDELLQVAAVDLLSRRWM